MTSDTGVREVVREVEVWQKWSGAAVVPVPSSASFFENRKGVGPLQPPACGWESSRSLRAPTRGGGPFSFLTVTLHICMLPQPPEAGAT